MYRQAALSRGRPIRGRTCVWPQTGKETLVSDWVDLGSLVKDRHTKESGLQ